LLSLTAFATPAAPPINDPSAPNIGKIGNTPPRFPIGSIRFFVFFVFVFIPIPIFVLAFIAAQTAVAAALSPRVESLATMRLRAFLANILSATCDRMYGVYLDKDRMMFGSKRFDVDKTDNIIIDVRYVGTPGLYELIFKRVPDDVICMEDDKQKYKSMLLTTNAHRYNHDPHDCIRGNRGYKHVIAPLMSIEPKKKFGRGLLRAMTLNDNVIDYVHWDDFNDLVDRLRLLKASRQAAHRS